MNISFRKIEWKQELVMSQECVFTKQTTQNEMRDGLQWRYSRNVLQKLVQGIWGLLANSGVCVVNVVLLLWPDSVDNVISDAVWPDSVENVMSGAAVWPDSEADGMSNNTVTR